MKALIIAALMIVSAFSVMAAPQKAEQLPDHPEGMVGFETGNGGWQVWYEGVHYVFKDIGQGLRNMWTMHPSEMYQFKANSVGPTE